MSAFDPLRTLATVIVRAALRAEAIVNRTILPSLKVARWVVLTRWIAVPVFLPGQSTLSNLQTAPVGHPVAPTVPCLRLRVAIRPRSAELQRPVKCTARLRPPQSATWTVRLTCPSSIAARDPREHLASAND